LFGLKPQPWRPLRWCGSVGNRFSEARKNICAIGGLEHEIRRPQNMTPRLKRFPACCHIYVGRVETGAATRLDPFSESKVPYLAAVQAAERIELAR
jgi:hypothetical protein